MHIRTLIILLACFCTFNNHANALLRITPEQRKQLEYFDEELNVALGTKDSKVLGLLQTFSRQLSVRVQETLAGRQHIRTDGTVALEEILSFHVESLINQLPLNDEEAAACRKLANERFEQGSKNMAYKKMSSSIAVGLITTILVAILVHYLLFSTGNRAF